MNADDAPKGSEEVPADERHQWRAVLYVPVSDDDALRIATHPAHKGPWVLGEIGTDIGVRVECRHCNDGFTSKPTACWMRIPDDAL